MRRIIYILLFIFSGNLLIAQGDVSTTKPLKVDAENNLDVKPSNQGTSLRIPSTIDQNLFSKNNKPTVRMLPTREF